MTTTEEAPTIGVTENKALVRRFYEELWDKGNLAFAHEVFADDYVRRDLRPTEAAPGGAGIAKIAEDFRRAFPNARWHVDLVFGEGDLVAAGGQQRGRSSQSGARLRLPARRRRSQG